MHRLRSRHSLLAAHSAPRLRDRTNHTCSNQQLPRSRNPSVVHSTTSHLEFSTRSTTLHSFLFFSNFTGHSLCFALFLVCLLPSTYLLALRYLWRHSCLASHSLTRPANRLPTQQTSPQNRDSKAQGHTVLASGQAAHDLMSRGPMESPRHSSSKWRRETSERAC